MVLFTVEYSEHMYQQKKEHVTVVDVEEDVTEE